MIYVGGAENKREIYRLAPTLGVSKAKMFDRREPDEAALGTGPAPPHQHLNVLRTVHHTADVLPPQ